MIYLQQQNTNSGIGDNALWRRYRMLPVPVKKTRGKRWEHQLILGAPSSNKNNDDEKQLAGGDIKTSTGHQRENNGAMDDMM